MRRIIRGKPLLVVTAAATAGVIAGCTSTPAPVDSSYVSGNLAIVDVGPPDTISGNLDAGCFVPSCDAGLPPDTGTTDDAAVVDDTGTDGGP